MKKDEWSNKTIRRDDFENLVQREATRMKRIMHALPLMSCDPTPLFNGIERRARISVYGMLIAGGATLEGV